MSQLCDKHCDAISVKTDGTTAQETTITLLQQARQQACQACTMNCDNHDLLQSGGSKRKYKKRKSGKKKRKSGKKKRRSMKKKRKSMKKKRKSIKKKRKSIKRKR